MAKTITINFVSGKSVLLPAMTDKQAQECIKALEAGRDGTTHITDDNGLQCVVYRAQIAWLNVETV